MLRIWQRPGAHFMGLDERETFPDAAHLATFGCRMRSGVESSKARAIGELGIGGLRGPKPMAGEAMDFR